MSQPSISKKQNSKPTLHLTVKERILIGFYFQAPRGAQ